MSSMCEQVAIKVVDKEGMDETMTIVSKQFTS